MRSSGWVMAGALAGFFVVAGAGAAGAQESGREAEQVSVPWVLFGHVDALRLGKTDEGASPLPYRGSLLGGELGYQRTMKGGLLEVVVGVSTGTLTSSITGDDGYPSERVLVPRLRLGWVRPMGTLFDDRVFLVAGVRADAQAPLRTHSYVEDGTERFGDLLVPIQLAGGWDGELGSFRLSQRLAIAVLSVVARSPYSGLEFVPDVGVDWAWELSGFDHALRVERPAGDRVDLRAGLTTTFLRHSDPHELRLVTHRLSLGAAVRFGGDA